MNQDGLDVDQLDLSGNSPLHLAARTGNTKTASTLLNFGAIKVSKYLINISDQISICLVLKSKH